MKSHKVEFETLQHVLESATAIIFDDELMHPTVDGDSIIFGDGENGDPQIFQQDTCHNITCSKDREKDVVSFMDQHGNKFVVETLEPSGGDYLSMREQILQFQSAAHVRILDCETVMLNDEKIDIPEDFDFESLGYRIEEKDDFIDRLCQWIGEANSSDRGLMKADLLMIATQNDPYFFSSISTNEYLFPSDQHLNTSLQKITEELKEQVEAAASMDVRAGMGA